MERGVASHAQLSVRINVPNRQKMPPQSRYTNIYLTNNKSIKNVSFRELAWQFKGTMARILIVWYGIYW